MSAYVPEFTYGFTGWDERGQPTYGLEPWPEHLRPRNIARPPTDVRTEAFVDDDPCTPPGSGMRSCAFPALAEGNGVFFLTLAKGDKLSIATTIERLINMLDDLDDDPDLEPSLAGTGGDDREGDDADQWNGAGYVFGQCEDDEPDFDDEPWLGAPERHPASFESPWGRSGELRRDYSRSQADWAAGGRDDREDDSEDEGAVTGDDEYSLGWSEAGSLVGNLSAGAFGEGEGEPELGWTEAIDQTLATQEDHSGWKVQDGEPDLGFVGTATGWRDGEGLDDREEGDDERELNGDEADFDGGEGDAPIFIPAQLRA